MLGLSFPCLPCSRKCDPARTHAHWERAKFSRKHALAVSVRRNAGRNAYNAVHIMDTAGRDASGGSGNYLKGHRNEHSSRYGQFRHASKLRAVIAQVLGRSECYSMNIGMICFARLMAVDDIAKTGGTTSAPSVRCRHHAAGGGALGFCIPTISGAVVP